MNIMVKNGSYDTEKLVKIANNNVANMEEASRENPTLVYKYPIGYVLPLGTLGNAPNQSNQFKSNFHIIAYTVADGLSNRVTDFADFNLGDQLTDHGQLAKLGKQLEDLAVEQLGKGWAITIFNVKIPVAVSSMCNGTKDIDSARQAMEELFNIVKNRLQRLSEAKEQSPWGHELIELFYADLKAISIEITKLVDKRSASEEDPTGICSKVIIETLVYDDYANGLRLLTNTESFASTTIRRHKYSDDTILYVLKARIVGEPLTQRPVRQFNGRSQLSGEYEETDLMSGCAERILYNIVNKNYKHWSFMSIPTSLKVTLQKMD